MTKNSSPDIMIEGKNDGDGSFSTLLDNSLKIFFKDALRISLRNPIQAFSFLKTVLNQKRAARVRAEWKERGIHVPPIVIFSITNRCNLHCKGCYSWALQRSSDEEMSDEKLFDVLGEAKELGISFFVVAGGEPFLRPEFIEMTNSFPQIIFLIFTNGLLIGPEMVRKLKKQKNVVPVVSLEGYEEDTDRRRGEGAKGCSATCRK